jgi:hypothetical protein
LGVRSGDVAMVQVLSIWGRIVPVLLETRLPGLAHGVWEFS